MLSYNLRIAIRAFWRKKNFTFIAHAVKAALVKSHYSLKNE
jgi:hypothetical protein